jgi:phospholipase C
MRLRHRVVPPTLAFLAFALAALSACSGGGGQPSPAPPAADSGGKVSKPPKKRASPIQHVVIIVQENQSYDHLFGGDQIGNYSLTCKTHTGATPPLTAQHLGAATGTSHMSTDFAVEYDGGAMDGWDLDPGGGPGKPQLGACTYTYPSDIQPYTQMANQYVLADNFFTSHIDGSFVAHQYLIAAQANRAVNLPTGAWGCSNGSAPDWVPTLNSDRTVGPWEAPCFTYTTLADELDAAGLTWRYYAPAPADSGGSWSAFQAINQIYNGPDWTKDVISPQTNILTDIPNGTLDNVTWVVPDYCASDHPGSLGSQGCPVPDGPSWVASIVNAIGESQYWNNTVIFVTWDEWGGEFDHASPPYVDYDGLGFRVPLLCISPYAYAGQVNHTSLEMAGIVRYVENTFGLSTMAAADARATAADSGCTNPSQSSPRSFTPIASQFSARHFLHRKPSKVPPDDQ